MQEQKLYYLLSVKKPARLWSHLLDDERLVLELPELKDETHFSVEIVQVGIEALVLERHRGQVQLRRHGSGKTARKRKDHLECNTKILGLQQ